MALTDGPLFLPDDPPPSGGDLGLFGEVFDVLRAHGHRPGLHLVPADDTDHTGYRRAWLSAAGFGALGHSIEHAARLYVQAGASLAADPELRATLRRLQQRAA